MQNIKDRKFLGNLSKYLQNIAISSKIIKKINLSFFEKLFAGHIRASRGQRV
jgi:hypothetical protein